MKKIKNKNKSECIEIVTEIISVLRNEIFVDGSYEEQIKILEDFIYKIIRQFDFHKGLLLLKDFDSYKVIYNGFVITNANDKQIKQFNRLELDKYIEILKKYKFDSYNSKIDENINNISLIADFEKKENKNLNIIIPLFLKEELLGVLEFELDKKLAPDDRNLLDLIISQFSQSINSNYLYLNSRRRLLTLEVVSKIKDAISSILDLSLLFPMLLDIAIKEINAEVGALILLNSDQSINNVICLGIDEDILKKVIRTDENLNLIDWLIKEKRLINLTQEDILKDFEIPLRFKSKFFSVISSPIIIKSKIIGIIILFNKHENRTLCEFGGHDVVFLNTIIGQSAISIENAELVEEILQIKTLNENILQSIKTGLITTDKSGVIQFFNKGSETITKYEFDEVKGESFVDFFKLKEKTKKDLVNNSFFDDSITFVRKDGNKITLHLIIDPLLNVDKKKEGIVIYFEDITESLMLQKQIQRSEKLAALGEFSADVAHEIKNPLTSILGFTQMLPYRTGDKAFIDNYINIITEEVTRLNTTVEKLLDFAKPKEEGFEKIRLNDVIIDSLDLLMIEAKRNSVKIIKNLVAEDDLINGEKDSLVQVLINIVLNGIQALTEYREEGFIKISSENLIKDNTEYILLTIEDNGPGIQVEKLDEIFNPFFSTKEKGTGLGLSISFRIIEQHNGTIEVSNKTGEKNNGALFKIFLPIIVINE